MTRLFFIIVALTGLTNMVHAGDLKPQATCPIEGQPIDKALYVDTKTQRIYACSTSCVELIKAKPDDAVASLKAKGEAPAQLQVMCPVMTEKQVRKSLHVDHEGKRVFLCCKDCLKKVTKNPAKYIAKLEAEGILVQTYQTHCPVMTNEVIDATMTKFVDYDGKRIYTCCKDCIEKIASDPEKYVSQLEAEGITLDKSE